MFWEIYQQSKIWDAAETASRAESKTDNIKYDVRDLERKVDAMALTCQAMWEVLREQTGMTDEQLAAKVREVDLRDGQANGKLGGGQQCAKCGRSVNQRHRKCIYCGEPVDKDHVFGQ